MISKIDPADIIDGIKEMLSTRIPKTFQLDPVKDIQVLCPMHKGTLGTQQLNIMLQTLLNTHSKTTIRFKHNDKVIQLRNNYDKDVFNGDVGYVCHIDTENSELSVNFSSHIVSYLFSELDELELAYAISIHKSQGSEYPCVIIPITMQHYTLLQRNLLYTAITRGKQLVILIGEPKAIYMAIRNQKNKNRYTNIVLDN